MGGFNANVTCPFTGKQLTIISAAAENDDLIILRDPHAAFPNDPIILTEMLLP